MKHIQFSNDLSKLKVAILIKESALNISEIESHYIKPLTNLGLSKEEIIVFSLDYTGNKVSATQAKSYLDKLVLALNKLNVNTLLVCSSEYFKYLTKVQKVEPCYGYVIDSKYKEGFKCILSSNYQALFYDDKIQNKLDLSLKTLVNYLHLNQEAINQDIIKFAEYPHTLHNIRVWLKKLQEYPVLALDIETFSLNFWEASIGTIAFAWNKSEGIAFSVDAHDTKDFIQYETNTSYFANPEIKSYLKKFFINYKGKLIGHNLSYDLKILVYELFMDNKQDMKGMLEGIQCLSKNIDDTYLITYLATNSTSGNELSLKPLAHEYAGNYGLDVSDIRQIPLQDLLVYNLKDCMCTWYVYEKYYPIMIQDQQEAIYNTIFKPMIPVLIQMELTGMPIDIDRVKEVDTELTGKRDSILNQLANNPLIKQCEARLKEIAFNKDYDTRLAKSKTGKIKEKEFDTFKDIKFNPGSGNHLAVLLYEVFGLEVTDYTDTKQPSTETKVLKKKMNQLMSKFNITKEELI